MAHILGVGMTRFGRRPEPLPDLLREAANAALRDAQIDRPDRIVVGVQNPEAFVGDANYAVRVASDLGLVPTPSVRVETGPSTGASAVEAACHAVDAGAARTVLVVCGEKMTHLGSQGAGEVLARMMSPLERRYGLTMPALAALQCKLAMRAHGWTREELDLVPVKAHAHGALNPYAHFQNPVNPEDVARSPVVADPLRVLDCAPVSDGAAALVVSDHGPVRVRAVGRATDLYAWTDRRYPGWTHGFAGTGIAARAAFEKSGLSHADVDVVETHDAFSHLDLANLVDLGFFDPREAAAALRNERTMLGGELPVNVSGGLKARGHPVGATGAAQLVELAWQLTGRAGARQVDGARVALAHNIGGFGNNVAVTLLEAAP